MRYKRNLLYLMATNRKPKRSQVNEPTGIALFQAQELRIRHTSINFNDCRLIGIFWRHRQFLSPGNASECVWQSNCLIAPLSIRSLCKRTQLLAECYSTIVNIAGDGRKEAVVLTGTRARHFIIFGLAPGCGTNVSRQTGRSKGRGQLVVQSSPSRMPILPFWHERT